MLLRILVTFVGVVLISGQARGWVDPPQTSEQNGASYALLQNGNVFKGRVLRQKDKIAIVADGSTLYLDPKQIEFVGPTMESLYMHQREGIRVWGTGEHWHLAHWCIENGLIAHAIGHYHVLESTAADSPKFKQLEHMLKDAILADEKVRSLVQPAKIPEHDKNPLAVPSAMGKDQVGAEVVYANAEMRSPRSTHDIPSYIRLTFHRSVLPVLISRCGQSGCHGLLGKSDFHIYQPVGDQAASMHAQDLDAVLRYIDRENVQDSELLAYATKAHGIQKNPSLNLAREDERLLVERINQWIKSLALTQRNEISMPSQFPVASVGHTASDPNSVTRAIATAPIPPDSSRAKRSDLMRPSGSKDRDARLSKPAREGAPAVFLDGRELSELETMIEALEKRTVGSDSTDKQTSQRDPFDPDVFNQKYR